MKAVTKIVFLDENGEKFFGEGPARLLRAVEETGSLRSAAMSMGMAYTKALKILSNAERALGVHLTERSAGGRAGGGSRLTDGGRIWLKRYEAYRDACVQMNAELYRRSFEPRIGCVIMASGMGRRFGGNKLTADFAGKEMIRWILEATDGVFERRLVVTRHKDVEKLAKEMGVSVLLHDLPLRSDAIRLGISEMEDMDGCMFCPSDQPLLKRDSILRMAAAFDGESILRAACGERNGAPVLFPGWCFERLARLEVGDGGGVIVKEHPEKVFCVQVSHPWELKDVDTPEDLRSLEAYARDAGCARAD